MSKMNEILKENNLVPFHMPGHKRNCEKFPVLGELGANFDITEIDGFDNMLHPEEIILDYMHRMERIFGSRKSYFLVGGSSAGILTAIKTISRENDVILMPRNSHKSVYNAVELCGLETIFYGETHKNYPDNSCNIDEIKELINTQKVDLMLVTSPSYEGYISNIEIISELCHAKNIPLIVDEAHGAHLSLTEYFGGSALKNGADIVVQSMHKTLLGLTSTAVVHLGKTEKNLVDIKKFEHNLSVFQTTSPSYILIASMCYCVDFLEKDRDIHFKYWREILGDFYKKSKNLVHLKIIDAQNKDKSKILIDCRKTSINGKELMEKLREKGIELEFCLADYALAMTGLGDTEESLNFLYKALAEIDSEINYAEFSTTKSLNVESGAIKYSIKKAMSLPNEVVEIANAIGRISAEHVFIYPPAMPFLIAGETITDWHIDVIDKAVRDNLNLSSTYNNTPKCIAVVE